MNDYSHPDLVTPPDLAPGRRLVLSPPHGGSFKAAVFDMGSTLLEFENVPWPVLYTVSLDTLRERLNRMGKTIPTKAALTERFFNRLEDCRAKIKAECLEYRVTELLENVLGDLGIVLTDSELKLAADAYYAPIRRQISVYPDAHRTLETLRDAGLKIGLLSNTCFRVEDHQEDLERFGLWGLLDASVFTSTEIYRKPHPAPFLKVCELLDVAPQDAFYVGDRQLEDVTGPLRAGMSPVLVRRPHRACDDSQHIPVSISALSELPTLLDIPS